MYFYRYSLKVSMFAIFNCAYPTFIRCHVNFFLHLYPYKKSFSIAINNSFLCPIGIFVSTKKTQLLCIWGIFAKLPYAGSCFYFVRLFVGRSHKCDFIDNYIEKYEFFLSLSTVSKTDANKSMLAFLSEQQL